MTIPKIFVSHSSKDVAFASKLVDDLNAAGAQAWMDSNDLGPGNFQERISEALTDCEWFLLVLTDNALDSKWVRQEVDAANRLKHQGHIHDLIFIKVGSVKSSDLPALWGVYNIFDASVDYNSARDRTMKAIGLTSAYYSANAPSLPYGTPMFGSTTQSTPTSNSLQIAAPTPVPASASYSTSNRRMLKRILPFVMLICVILALPVVMLISHRDFDIGFPLVFALVDIGVTFFSCLLAEPLGQALVRRVFGVKARMWAWAMTVCLLGAWLSYWNIPLLLHYFVGGYPLQFALNAFVGALVVSVLFHTISSRLYSQSMPRG